MKSILIGLTLTFWILWFPGYTQTDSVYCLSISKARLLVADALRLRVLDTLNGVLSARVDLLQSEQIKIHNSYSNLLKIEQDKLNFQKEITIHTEGLAGSYKEQVKFLEKQNKKHKWQKAGLAAALVGVIILSLTNQ